MQVDDIRPLLPWQSLEPSDARWGVEWALVPHWPPEAAFPGDRVAFFDHRDDVDSSALQQRNLVVDELRFSPDGELDRIAVVADQDLRHHENLFSLLRALTVRISAALPPPQPSRSRYFLCLEEHDVRLQHLSGPLVGEPRFERHHSETTRYGQIKSILIGH